MLCRLLKVGCGEEGRGLLWKYDTGGCSCDSGEGEEGDN
jgi:hypothetical protein